MLRLPPFHLRIADSITEAATVLADEPNARIVAGGTDLWPNMKRRHQQAETVVSLMKVPDLRGVSSNGEVRIGATTTLTDCVGDATIQARFPALGKAIESISSPHLRNMGTLGGNLCVDTRCTYYNQTEHWRQSIDYCMKEEGSICWVAPSSPRCWAHSATDAAPMLSALDARVKLVSKDGDRVLGIDELYRNDGIEYLGKRADEILTDVLVPNGSDAEHCRSAFFKLRRRGSIDFAVLSVGAAVWLDGSGHVERARIVLGAVASRPLPAEKAADTLIGKPLTEDTITEAAGLARKLATPMDNTDFQTQWRGKMVEAYTAAALREIAGRDPGLTIL